jgi:hypothetical protein
VSQSQFIYSGHLHFKKETINRLHVAHNNIFRMMFNLSRRCSVSQNFMWKGISNMIVIAGLTLSRF